MTSLFVEHLTVIDSAILDAARGLVGESWIVDVELHGELDDQSMVLDFGEVKRRLKRAIDSSVDHTLLVPRLAPELQFDETIERTQLIFKSDLGAIEHVSPPAAVSLLDTAEIDPVAIGTFLAPTFLGIVPPSVDAIDLRLRHEDIDGIFYHYVHGLKKHNGLCQRIAHGHRSRLQIRVDGERDSELETEWAMRWTDIYLGSREDIIARGNGRIRYGYDSAEGRFELAMPETRSDLLDADSTVERIAEHIARRVAELRPGAEIEVRAYEGVMKGAVARL